MKPRLLMFIDFLASRVVFIVFDWLICRIVNREACVDSRWEYRGSCIIEGFSDEFRCFVWLSFKFVFSFKRLWKSCAFFARTIHKITHLLVGENLQKVHCQGNSTPKKFLILQQFQLLPRIEFFVGAALRWEIVFKRDIKIFYDSDVILKWITTPTML